MTSFMDKLKRGAPSGSSPERGKKEKIELDAEVEKLDDFQSLVKYMVQKFEDLKVGVSEEMKDVKEKMATKEEVRGMTAVELDLLSMAERLRRARSGNSGYVDLTKEEFPHRKLVVSMLT